MNTKFKSISLFIALPALILFCLSAPALAQSEPAGQALVVDVSVDALFSVDLTPGSLGIRTLVSDFDDPSQGLTGNPRGVTCDGPEHALVIDNAAGTDGIGILFRVNINPGRQSFGDRTVISDFGDPAQGPTGEFPRGVILDGSGNALVIDPNIDILFLVDLETGNRTIISDFNNPAQGPLGATTSGLALDNAGGVLVADEDAGTNSDGALFHVDLTSGQRTIISDFGDPSQGPLGDCPFDVALDSSGNALVVDDDAGVNSLGALFLVDLTPGPTFGDRIFVSEFGNPAQGPLGRDPVGVALDGSGNALVSDQDGGIDNKGSLFIVDLTPGPTFGDRILASDFGNPAQGPLGGEPGGVAFKPPPPLARPIPTLSEWGLIATAAVLGLAGLYAARRRKVTA